MEFASKAPYVSRHTHVICMPAGRCCQAGQAASVQVSGVCYGVACNLGFAAEATGGEYTIMARSAWNSYLWGRSGKRWQTYKMHKHQTWTSSEHRLPPVWEAQLQGLNMLATECHQKHKGKWRYKRRPRVSLEPDQPARHTGRMDLSVMNVCTDSYCSRPTHKKLPSYSCLTILLWRSITVFLYTCLILFAHPVLWLLMTPVAMAGPSPLWAVHLLRLRFLHGNCKDLPQHGHRLVTAYHSYTASLSIWPICMDRKSDKAEPEGKIYISLTVRGRVWNFCDWNPKHGKIIRNNMNLANCI